MKGRVEVTEHAEQVAVFEWSAYQRKKYPELDLLIAIPNGGKRHIGTAMKLKAEGVKPGVPDILLPVSRHGFNALWIELKVGKNKPSPNQLYMMHRLTDEGAMCQVCWGAEQAILAIKAYIEDRE